MTDDNINVNSSVSLKGFEAFMLKLDGFIENIESIKRAKDDAAKQAPNDPDLAKLIFDLWAQKQRLEEIKNKNKGNNK